MTDVFLYQGEPSAADVKLRDPTQASASITGTAAAGQGSQSADASALLQFIGTQTAGQGAQTADASDIEQFIATAVSGQGTQSADAADIEAFLAAATSGQGTQAAAAAALLRFISRTDAAQGAQSVDAAGAEVSDVTGDATSGQDAQSVDASGVNDSIVSETPRLMSVFIPDMGESSAPRRVIAMPRRGAGASEQGAQAVQAAGAVVLPAKLAGDGDASQASAEVIAIGAVDNRIPNNRRKAKLAALLLAA